MPSPIVVGFTPLLSGAYTAWAGAIGWCRATPSVLLSCRRETSSRALGSPRSKKPRDSSPRSSPASTHAVVARAASLPDMPQLDELNAVDRLDAYLRAGDS